MNSLDVDNMLSPLDEDHGLSSFHLRDIIAPLYRHRVGIGIVVGACLLIGVAMVLLLPRIYEARASVQIDMQAAKVLGTEDTQESVPANDSDLFLKTEVDVLNSRSLARRVAEKMALNVNDNFLTTMGVTPDSNINSAEGRMEEVADVLQDKLVVYLPRNSRVTGISFRSRDPALAAKVANSYAENFITNNIEQKYSTSDYARSFLQNQLDQTKLKLENSERALIDYGRTQRLIDVSGDTSGATGGGVWSSSHNSSSLLTSNLVDLNTSLSAAQTARIAAEERWNQIKNTPVTAIPEVLNNPAMNALLQKRAELNADLLQLKQHLKPDHPTVAQLQAQLGEIDKQSKALGESIRDSVRIQYLVAQRQEQSISDQVNGLVGNALSEQERQVRFNILKREVDTNRQLFEALLTRYGQLNAEAGVSSNNITLIDKAEVPREPVSPKIPLILAGSLFLGLSLAALYTYLREHFDDSIRNPQDVEEKLGMPLLGVVPATTDKQNIGDAIGDPKSPIAEAYNTIRTSIELSSSKQLFTSLLVTSSSLGEGKSTTAYALARNFAFLGRKVLLIDADMRRPSQHGLFGLEPGKKGLSTTLAGMHPPSEAIIVTEYQNLSLMPCGPLPPNPAAALRSDRLSELLEQLNSSYDLLMIDGPPVLALADAVEISTAAQATLFVIEAGGSQLGQTRVSVKKLVRASHMLVGGIVTKYKANDGSYYSTYYTYNYGQK